MEFGHHIREYKDAIFRCLAELIAIPSVADATSQLEGKPFGAEAARALEYVLTKGQAMGFAVKNVGNYAGHVEYDCGKEGTAAVLSHVDVVPAGSGWETDPYVLTERDGLLYGRGVLDDKGAAIVSLFCLKALRDYGVTGKRKLRCIFGSGEEIGMVDMPHYFAEEPLPDLSFTPDGDYGICNREKGILHFTLTCDSDSSFVAEFAAGQVVNAVPDHARAVLRCTEAEAEQLQAIAASSGEDYTFTWDAVAQTASISLKGRAAHAREPENGHSAVLHLLDLLQQAFGVERLGTLLRFLWEKVGLETDGKRFGIQQSDEPSGALTLNVGVVQIDDAVATASVDIRYPVTVDGETIIQQLQTCAESAGITYATLENLAPLYAKEDSLLVSILRRAYASATGEEARLYSTGGGSYARCISGRCVAFGPVFPNEPDRRMHQCGEHIDMECFMRHAEICLEAMYQMIIT